MPQKKRKIYEPCAICGYSLYTERHHPDGKATFITVRNRSQFYNIPFSSFQSPSDAEKEFEWLEYLYPMNVRIDEQHVNSQSFVILCANCHALVTRLNYSIDEVRELSASRAHQDVRL